MKSSMPFSLGNHFGITRVIFLSIMAHVILNILAYPASAEDDPVIEVTGRVRSLATIIDNDPFDDDTELLHLIIHRMMIDGAAGENVGFEIHFVDTLSASSGSSPFGAALFTTSRADARYRAVDLAWTLYDEDPAHADMVIDRLNISFELPNADVTIGRQAITFGKAYFWNPLDIFLPFNAQQVEREYKAGVDALRVDITLGDFSGLNIIAAPGRELGVDGTFLKKGGSFGGSWFASALLARYFTSINGWDYAIQGGKVYGGYHLGCGLVGDIGGYQVRGEAAYLFAEDSPPMPAFFSGDLIEDNLVVVAGAGKYFTDELDIEVEYLFNGAGDPDDLAASILRLFNGGTLQLGRRLAGALVMYEFDPLTSLQVVGIYSFSDSSGLLQPVISYSVDDNSDIRIGGAFNFGPGMDGAPASPAGIRSEFGILPDFYFFEYQQYF